MWESIVLTLLVTAGNNIGKVLQKKGTVILPPLSFKLKELDSGLLGWDENSSDTPQSDVGRNSGCLIKKKQTQEGKEGEAIF